MCAVLRDTQVIVGVYHKKIFMLFFNMRDLFFPDCGKNPLSCFCSMCFSNLSCKQVYHLIIWHFFVSRSHLNCKRNILCQCLSYSGNSAFFFVCEMLITFRIFACLPLCVSACCSLWVRISAAEICPVILTILF